MSDTATLNRPQTTDRTTAAPRRGRAALRALRTAFTRSVAIVLFLALWELLPRAGVVDRVFLPPFSSVLAAGWDLARSGQLADNLQASLIRSLAGLLLATAVTIPLGILVGWYKPVSDALGPLLELFRNTSALALLPVFVLLLGLGESSKIALVTFACAWPILLNTISAVREVDPLLLKSARSLGLSPAAVFAKVVLPASIPTLFTGIRLAGAYSILVLIAAEMTGAKAGLGYLITSAQYTFRIPEMYAGIITISLLGVVINGALLLAERRLSRWRS